MTNVRTVIHFGLIEETPHLAFKGDLWGAYVKVVSENSLCSNKNPLHMAISAVPWERPIMIITAVKTIIPSAITVKGSGQVSEGFKVDL